MALAEDRIEIEGYIRRQVWEEILQKRVARLYTGATVYNLPYIYTEPQQDDMEWVPVRIVIKLEEDQREG